MRYLLDTNVCIAAIRNHPRVVERMQRVSPSECAISAITIYELLVGVEKCMRPDVERKKVELLIGSLVELPFASQAGKDAAKIRANLEANGLSIGPYDLLLAGQAVNAGLRLITNNTREFSRVDGLALEDWSVESQ